MFAMGGRMDRLQSFMDEKEGQAQSVKLEADPMPTCLWDPGRCCHLATPMQLYVPQVHTQRTAFQSLPGLPYP